MSDELHRQSKEHGVSLSEMRFEEAPAAERGTPKAALVQPDIDADLSSAHQRDYSSIPVCCSLPMGFWRRTIPPLASVGMTEAEAHRHGSDVEVKLIDTSVWYSSRRTGESHSGARSTAG